MTKYLTAVRQASSRRHTADHKYRAAIRAAQENGHSLSEIGRAAGITPQGVRYLLVPDPRKDKAT